MTRWRIKLVPDATPNADGRWIDVTKAWPSRRLTTTK